MIARTESRLIPVDNFSSRASPQAAVASKAPAGMSPRRRERVESRRITEDLEMCWRLSIGGAHAHRHRVGRELSDTIEIPRGKSKHARKRSNDVTGGALHVNRPRG